MATVVAKGKKRKTEKAHGRAIADYKLWLECNPGSMHGERVAAFNEACDTAAEDVKKDA